MSATGTAMAKKSGQTTKGQAAAQEAAAKMGAVIVPAGNGGYTLMPKGSAAAKAEVERQRLIDAAKAELAASETPAAAGPQFSEINYQGNLKGTDYMWGVHAAGCADIQKEIKRQFGKRAEGQTEWLLTDHVATTMRELLDKIVDGETRGLGWGDENVKVHNCVRQEFARQAKLDRTLGKVETTEQVIAREVAEGRLTPVGRAAEPKAKKPYNPEKLSGAPAAGKAPQKGQLPLGLLRMLVKRNPNSETLKAALAAAEAGATAPAKKGKKAKK